MSTTRISFPNGSTAGLGDIVGGGCIFTALACDIVPDSPSHAVLTLVAHRRYYYLSPSASVSILGKSRGWGTTLGAHQRAQPLIRHRYRPLFIGQLAVLVLGAGVLPPRTSPSFCHPSRSQLALDAECGREEEKRHPGTVFGRLPTTTPSRWGACTAWGFCARVRLPVQG